MSSDLPRLIDIATGALAGATLGTLAMSYMQSPNNTLQPSQTVASTPKPPRKEYPEEVKEEMFSRVGTFFGKEGLKKLSESFVVVSCPHLRNANLEC